MVHNANWKTPSAFLVALVAILWFAAPTGIFAQNKDPQDAASSKQIEEDPIVLSVRSTNPTSMDELAEAVGIMLDIDREDEARVYLVKLLGIDATDIQWYQLNRKHSTAFLLDLNSRPGLSPENSQLVNRVMTAVRKIHSDPARLNGLVKQLSDTNEIRRAQALADLRNLGGPSAAALLSALADDSRSAEFPTLVSALRRLGDSAEAPLRAGLLSPSRRVRIVSADQLGRFRSRASLDMLLAARISDEQDGLLNQTVWMSVGKIAGRQPEMKETLATVLRSANDYLYQREKLIGDYENKIAVWNWQDGQLVGEGVPKHVASRIFSYRRARALYRHDPKSETYQRLYCLCLLEAAKVRAGITNPLPIDSLDQPELKDVGLVERILTDAMDADRIPAAIAATEILTRIGDASLVASKNGRLRPLVQAMTFGDRRLQYSATMAIMKLGPTQPFPGSSHVSRSLVFLVGSSGSPSSVVGHSDRSQCQTMAASLGQTGLRGEITTSARELFRRAVSDSDVEFLLVSDTLDLPDYAELIQQLRHDWRTKRIPIAMLTRKVNEARGQRVARRDPFTVQIPWTTDPSLLARQITRLLELNQLTRVDANERAEHAAEASNWLDKISGDPGLATIYQLSSHEKQLNAALFLPNVSAQVSRVVARLATRDGQRSLLSVVNDSGQSTENRQAAAVAFSASVGKSGTLLTTTEVLAQFERYNASEFENAESQQILASVLDAIESRAKKK